ncbi:hypothetical protein DYU05_11650 [Mucilaginibacter terrenus]|uniref:Uncharacterized protein n=1 Tax=Mucilaginibacter terrenus TaxID=2482727 RepID=A0A3E2NPA2_9SPHI|nr:hypothetical protein [Mucilaginibacter terrenus]RFZ82812.1 hypothetical protein DYU05_11650 [Mucilaginibacter terrenus]
MQRAYQSIYVSFYRWNFKTFGQGKSLPEFRSMFNVSFLLVVVLTNAMLLTKLLVKANWLTLGMGACVAIVAGAIMFLLANHFILLNNKRFSKLNMQLANMDHRKVNIYSTALLVNVCIACSLCFL